MARTGLTPEEIFAAADELAGLGVTPTNEKVRARLGRGSLTTIQPQLAAWKAMRRDQSKAVLGETLKSEILRLAESVWRRVEAEAEARADARVLMAESRCAELERQAEALRGDLEALSARLKVIEYERDRLSGRLEECRRQAREGIEAVETQLLAARRQNEGLAAELGTAKAERDQARQETKRLRAQHKAMTDGVERAKSLHAAMQLERDQALAEAKRCGDQVRALELEAGEAAQWKARALTAEARASTLERMIESAGRFGQNHREENHASKTSR